MGDHFHRGGYPPGPPRDFRRDGEGRYYGHHVPDHYGPPGGGYPPPHRQDPIKQERDPFFDRRPMEPAPPMHNMAIKNEFKQEEPEPGHRGPSAGGPPQSFQNRKRPYEERGRGYYEHRDDRRGRSPQGRGGGSGDDEDDVFDENYVVLDNYNSDLHFKLSKDRTVGFPLTMEGFAYLWSGARATHGVNRGRVCFEMKITEEIAVGHLPANEPDPHVVRVGWSLDSCSTQLGEEMYSYGYGGTAKKSTNSKFENYGETFAENDVIGCFIDFEVRGDIEISFSKNGRYLGTAFRVSRGSVGNQAFFPHVLVKNCCVEFNFGQRAEPFCSCPPGFTFIQHVPHFEKIRGTEPPKNKGECEILMMVGLPGAGKTTWAMKHSAANPGKKYNILGTNAIMEKMRVMGLRRQRNYAGRWDVLIQQATKCLNQLIQIAARRKRNYILDQTNVYATAQRRKMRPFEGFHRKAIIICPTDDDLRDRIVKRTDEEGKDVPDHAVLEMKANFSLPDPGDFLEEVIFIELQKEEAEKLISQYNEEGKKAGQPPEKKFRGRGGGPPGGGGVGRGEAPRGEFQRFDNRGPPGGPGGRGGFPGRGGNSGGGYNRGGGPGGGEYHLTEEETTHKAGGLGTPRIMVQNIGVAMVLIVKHTTTRLQATEAAVMVVAVQHQIPLLTVHPAATVKDRQTSGKEVTVVLEDIARAEAMAQGVVEIMDQEAAVGVAITRVEEAVQEATTREEEVVVATAREAQVAITKVAVVTARVLEAAVATAKEVEDTTKVVLEVATAVKATLTVKATVVEHKATINLHPRAPHPLSRHIVRVAMVNSTSNRMETSNGTSIKATDRHQIPIPAKRKAKVSGASGTTEQEAAVMTSPVDTEGPREIPRESDICFGFIPGLTEILNHIGLNFLLF